MESDETEQLLRVSESLVWLPVFDTSLLHLSDVETHPEETYGSIKTCIYIQDVPITHVLLLYGSVACEYRLSNFYFRDI